MFEFREDYTVPLPNLEASLSEFQESSFKDSHGLIVEIAAIHEGVTSNFTEYRSAALANALHTWYSPYQKPIIMNHDRNSEPVGRVIGAVMAQEEDGTPFVKIQAAIVDPLAIQKVMDRRYITGSIGGRTDEAICSICDTDWANPKEGTRGMPCSHQRGKIYKGKLATLAMNRITFVEYSFVNVPADAKSGVRSMASQESDEWTHPAKFFALDLGRESIVEYKESDQSIDILEEMQKKKATSLYHEIKGAFIQAQSFDNSENEESAIDYIGDTKKNDGIETSSEENESMSDKTVETAENQDEDILSIMDDLNEDLNAVDDEVQEEETSEESDDTEEQESTEENEDDTDKTDDESDTEEADQAQDTDEAEEDDASETLDTDEADAEDEVEEGEENEDDEQTDDTELTAEGDESTVEELKSQVASLQEENGKLKKALHRTLAERVVDAKIDRGMVEASARAESVNEHAARTVSSLADTLRDLAAMPKTDAKERDWPKGEITPKAEAVDGEEGTEILDATEEEQKLAPELTFENILVDTMMGRRSL